MVDFRLNDDGDLELADFGESCRDALSGSRTLVSSRHYIDPKAMVSKAVQEERTRPLKSARSHADRGCCGRSVHETDAQLAVMRREVVGYLNELQCYAPELAANPPEWMPWKYSRGNIMGLPGRKGSTAAMLR
jgi:hypothetical protein